MWVLRYPLLFVKPHINLAGLKVKTTWNNWLLVHSVPTASTAKKKQIWTFTPWKWGFTFAKIRMSKFTKKGKKIWKIQRIKIKATNNKRTNTLEVKALLQVYRWCYKNDFLMSTKSCLRIFFRSTKKKLLKIIENVGKRKIVIKD